MNNFYQNLLHIYSQHHEHDEVFIVGSRNALEKLRDTLNTVLQTGTPNSFLSFTRDGEGFPTIVKITDEQKDWDELRLPYNDFTNYIGITPTGKLPYELVKDQYKYLCNPKE